MIDVENMKLYRNMETASGCVTITANQYLSFAHVMTIKTYPLDGQDFGQNVT